MARATKAASRQAPGTQAPAQPPAVVPQPAPGHPYAALDRSVMGNLARLTSGLSPHAMIDAWTDWAMHLARAPGRQLELAERAQANARSLAGFATATLLGQKADPPFAPGPHDTRWSHAGWVAPPFAMWQQAFLGVQDWWQAATADLPGLRTQNAQRTGFMMRQLLDTVSPSNFPLGNPEILEATARTRGRNLIEGAAHFADDARHILTQQHRPVPADRKSVV